MGMTDKQAKELGQLLAEARHRKGWGVRDVATQLGVSFSWVAKVERGEYATVPPDRLARLADVLNVAPSRIDRLVAGSMARSLPEIRTYFRAKYRLTVEESEQIARYVERYIDKPEEPAA